MAIMATFRLLKATTPTLRRTAIMATLRPRKVTNGRQESRIAVCRATLVETAPGVTLKDVMAKTEAELEVPKHVPQMSI
jgi:hypothetical protein